jgi:hypothetical protein
MSRFLEIDGDDQKLLLEEGPLRVAVQALRAPGSPGRVRESRLCRVATSASQYRRKPPVTRHRTYLRTTTPMARPARRSRSE